jgi:hypothetical protein
MKRPPCQLLDDYLDHDLEPGDHTRFVAHLSKCPSCQQAVADYNRLENILTEAIALEPIPENITARIEAGLQRQGLWRWGVASAMLAATAAAIWLIAHYFSQTPELNLSVVEVTTPPAESKTSPSAGPVRISFPADANVLVMREKSESPNVTVVHVYSGLMPAHPRTKARETMPSIPERTEQ